MIRYLTWMDSLQSFFAQDNFWVTLTFFGLAIIGVVSQIVLYYSVYRLKESTMKLNMAKARSLSSTLSENDIAILGEFIDTTIGGFYVDEYVNNAKVKDIVDTCFRGVLNFIGSEDNIDLDFSEEAELEEPKSTPGGFAMKFLSVEEFENFDSLPDQARINFKKSIADVNSGEVWNALSRARMTLEGELKLRLQGIGLHKKRLGAGGMLNILRQNMKISDGDYKSLRYAIGVCNRGVHGEDVHPAHAGEAIHVIVSYLTSDESLQNSL